MIRLPEDCYTNPRSYWAFFPTMACNAPCTYCLVHSRGPIKIPKTLPPKAWLGFWNDVEHPKGQRLSILGGEPTLYEGFLELVNNLKDYNLTYTTNLATKFYTEKQYKQLSPASTLRINTTFHPSVIDIHTYCKQVLALRDYGLCVDQVAMVDDPTSRSKPYQDVAATYGLTLRAVPFLGFFYRGQFARDSGYDICRPCNLLPGEQEIKSVANESGIRSIKSYREHCGAKTPKTGLCRHHRWCFLVGPDGNVYQCHHKLYYQKDCRGSILTREWDVPSSPLTCDSLGFCHFCDIPRKYWSGDIVEEKK